MLVMQKPELLIRIIAGIATLPISRLGWDTAMSCVPKSFFSNTGKTLPYPPKIEYSFDVPWDRKNYFWLIKVPLPIPEKDDLYKMSTTETEWFVLWKPLSLDRGEVIKGRATRVWRAWKYSDADLPETDRKVSQSYDD